LVAVKNEVTATESNYCSHNTGNYLWKLQCVSNAVIADTLRIR